MDAYAKAVADARRSTQPQWRRLADDEQVPTDKPWRIVLVPQERWRAEYNLDVRECGEAMCAQLMCEDLSGSWSMGYDAHVEVQE